MRTAANYRALLHASSLAAGQSGQLWSQGFVAALHANGLALSAHPGVGSCYPDDFAYIAPTPEPDAAISWPADTYVVWQPEARRP